MAGVRSLIIKVLAHQRLVSGLLPILNDSRVIFLSSAGHSQAPPGGVDYESLVRVEQDTAQQALDRQPNVWVDYGQSKWGDIALAKQLDKLYGPAAGGTIISISIHPGEPPADASCYFIC
jgi:NAD(P)-dependent dehydrogenase (short-subunit alcohol dehydrogenase family)